VAKTGYDRKWLPVRIISWTGRGCTSAISTGPSSQRWRPIKIRRRSFEGCSWFVSNSAKMVLVPGRAAPVSRLRTLQVRRAQGPTHRHQGTPHIVEVSFQGGVLSSELHRNVSCGSAHPAATQRNQGTTNGVQDTVQFRFPFRRRGDIHAQVENTEDGCIVTITVTGLSTTHRCLLHWCATVTST
jgi:hypothetical protein